MIPKIDFVYSGVYDGIWLKPKNKLDQKFIKKYFNSIEKIWRKEGGKILKEISKISSLKWKEKKVKCYFISGGRCFSDPLTIKYFKNKNQFIDTLTHELIHQIQIQNADWDKWKKYHKYGKESFKTQSHIFLHAVHYKILSNLYGRNRLEKNIRRHNKWKDYKKAWEIVIKETPEKIIKEFKKSQN